MRKLDIFNHIWPTEFFDALIGHIGQMTDITLRSGALSLRSGAVSMITNLDRRFEVMDMFGESYQQVLTLASPPLEKIADPEKALELSKVGSDSMASLCDKYPERFPAFVVGTVPMNHGTGMASKSQRAIEELGAVGTQIYTNIKGQPLDHPDFEAFFEYMNESGKPIWMHPFLRYRSNQAVFETYMVSTSRYSDQICMWCGGVLMYHTIRRK